MKDKSTVDLCYTKEECCGCYLCKKICNLDAIKFVEDEEGFMYPEIDKSICVGCERCLKNCKFKNDIKSKENRHNEYHNSFYACRIKDEKELMESSSGGMFTALSGYLLENGGAVVCSLYNYKNNSVEYRLIESKECIGKARGSKYIQSKMGNIYDVCYKWLIDNPGKKIIFFGVGCQAAAFESYMTMKEMIDDVYVVDIICHGSPSPLIWREYIDILEKKYEGKISSVNFRDKRNGWLKPEEVAKINGQEVSLKEYKKLYSRRYMMRPSCHICPYTKVTRNTDITIGDYWGVENYYYEFYSEKGNSLVIIQSAKGEELFDKVKPYIEYIECEQEKCIQLNLCNPTSKSKYRNIFWKDYKKYGLKYVLNLYVRDNYLNKIKRYLKNIMQHK